jgi:mono/diheme cytochrome c family protein
VHTPVKLVVLQFIAAAFAGAAPGAADLEFFEKQVRPVLAENCFACHSSKALSVFANLRLDSRAGVLKGGDQGPVVTPGDPGASKLIRMLRGEGMQMPPTGKLADDKIAAMERWIELGLPWPEEAAPAPDPSAKFDLEARRAEHWAWQPVRKPAVPTVQADAWPLNEVDRFLLAKLESEGLQPAGDADRRTFIRRATFDLTGLPPTPAEIDAFLADGAPDAYDKLVDRLLESPHFGEAWARHWMDLVRYAESHGSEGDPDTPFAWRYRDYLVRAFNADVPYDQLIREHLAGDLLAKPRLNPELQINESVLGTAHLRLVEHGFQPVDPWEDRVKWADNQIDVFAKAFQGLTVSCARCHDHKFDAISQKDYYALFGVFKGARPTQRAIDTPEHLNLNRDRLVEIKRELRDKLADVWSEKARGLGQALLDGKMTKALEDALETPDHPLAPWAVLREKSGPAFQQSWQAFETSWRDEMAAREAYNATGFAEQWDVRKPEDYAKWLRHGTGLPDAPTPAGEFEVPPDGAQLVSRIYPAGVYTNLVSRKHDGVLQSPRFKIDSDYISFEVSGGNFSFVQLIIENYAAPRAGIYWLRYSPKKDDKVWATWKTDYWKGFTAYIEYATLDGETHFLPDKEDSAARPRVQPERDGRSWFGAGRVVFHDEDRTPRSLEEPILAILEGGAPASAEALAARYSEVLTAAVEGWRMGEMSDQQAWLLDFCVRNGLLPNGPQELDGVRPLVAEYRKLEKQIPVAQRAPGVIEEGGPDQPLLVRGNHKSPAEPVARRFLTALGGSDYPDPRSARLRLADEATSPDNPLTARVAVNRIWKYLFGDGIVRTEDNFGKLGETPTHPELLDWLAARFVEQGWSVKKTARLLATSRAYRMGSLSSPAAVESDPDNRLLSHMPIRRLEAESIRDAILAVSDELDPKMFGPSIPVYYAYDVGKTKGDNPKGPLDGDGRRAIYQEIRRNTHNPFLEVFDLPKPASTRGERDATNVPAQALTMLNSPFVIGEAEKWAAKLTKRQGDTPAGRVDAMFEKALGRKPSASERDRAQTYVAMLAAEHKADDPMESEPVWRDFAQSLFNLKEFLYLR